MARRATKDELETLGVVRCFQRFGHEARANHAASFRLGHQQRNAGGEFYYTTKYVPNRAFPTQREAVAAAVQALFGNSLK